MHNQNTATPKESSLIKTMALNPPSNSFVFRRHRPKVRLAMSRWDGQMLVCFLEFVDLRYESYDSLCQICLSFVSNLSGISIINMFDIQIQFKSGFVLAFHIQLNVEPNFRLTSQQNHTHSEYQETEHLHPKRLRPEDSEPSNSQHFDHPGIALTCSCSPNKRWWVSILWTSQHVWVIKPWPYLSAFSSSSPTRHQPPHILGILSKWPSCCNPDVEWQKIGRIEKTKSGLQKSRGTRAQGTEPMADSRPFIYGRKYITMTMEIKDHMYILTRGERPNK